MYIVVVVGVVVVVVVVVVSHAAASVFDFSRFPTRPTTKSQNIR